MKKVSQVLAMVFVVMMLVVGTVLAAPAVPTSGNIAAVTPAPPRLGDVFDVLAKVDTVHKVSRFGNSYLDFRYNVEDGSSAGTSLVATKGGQVSSMRVACDDVCESVYLVKGMVVIDISEQFEVLVPSGAYTDTYSVWTPFEDVDNWDKMLGAQKTDVLTQWVAKDLEVSMAPGDQIVVFAHDEDVLGVNVGIFASWSFTDTVPTASEPTTRIVKLTVPTK